MSSRLEAIRSVYAVSVARNLIKIEASEANSSSSIFEMEGFISDANYSAKKTTMVLFINGMHSEFYVIFFPFKYEKPHSNKQEQ